MDFHLSSEGLDLIKEFEQLRLVAYRDSAGVPTIGWGTTRIKGQRVRMGMTCTREQADEWLADDCRATVADLNDLIAVELMQFEFDALVVFAYNVGTSAFTKSSLLRAINSGATVTEDLFTRWNKIHDPQGNVVVLPGLTRRRKAEFALFTKHPTS